MRFCPGCGGPIERRIPELDDRERHVCTACDVVHYSNPKVVVGSVCTLGDRLLLCRRAIAPGRGLWTIPAGYLENGETVEEGTRREAWEEARAEIALEGLIAVYSIKRIDQVQLLYKARLTRPEVSAGPESLEVMLTEWHDIPWEELAFPTVHWVLRRARELRGQSGPFVPVGNPEADAALGGAPEDREAPSSGAAEISREHED
jgi:ADP-ribose pyrophosphatase YjhB (NUDIX family)